MKTIDDLVAAIEARYPCVDGIHATACQTGDEYVEIGHNMSNLIEDQGGPPGTYKGRPTLYLDMEDAVWHAWTALNEYADWWHREHPGESPRLYWRYEVPRAFLMTRPRTRRKAAVCYIRMRLVITAKPELAELPLAGFPAVPDQETWET